MPPKKPAPRSDELFGGRLGNMIDMDRAAVTEGWSRLVGQFGGQVKLIPVVVHAA